MRTVRSGPLTWAQHIFWFYNEPTFYREWSMDLQIGRDFELPAKVTASRLKAVLAECVERFEALRTIYVVRADGIPEQHVLDSYPPSLTDMDDEYPVRSDFREVPTFRCAVRLDGESVHDARITANQIDLDGESIATLVSVIEQRLAGVSWDRLVDPSRLLQPLDVAARQQTEAAVRSSSRGIDWFRKVRKESPRKLLPPMREEEAGGTEVSVLVDPDLLASADRLAKCCGVSSASVFHTLIALVIGAWAGRERLALTTATANRWQLGEKTMIGRLASEADCVIEVQPGDTASMLIKRTHGELFRGYLSAARDFGACTMEAVRDNARAGSDLAKDLFVEYLQFAPEVPTRDCPPTRSLHTEPQPGRGSQMRFHLTPMPPGIEITLAIDKTIMESSTAQRVLDLIANLVRRCAEDPETPAETLTASVVPAGSDAEWIEIDGNRFDTERIRRLLTEFDGVSEAALLPGADGGLDAFVQGRDVDFEALHEHMQRRVGIEPLTSMPTSYTLVADRAATNVCFRPRTDYRPTAADDKRIVALKEVFASLHPGLPFNPALTYAELNGGYLQIPAMLAGLEQAGLVGAHPNDFLGLLSMAALARGLRHARRSREMVDRPWP